MLIDDAIDFGFESSIPVLRMLDELRAREFYINFLGYEIDWEHRFRPEKPGSPLYMQIRMGESVLHLNGHAESDAPTSEVRIPVFRLDDYCAVLRDRWHNDNWCKEIASAGPPEIVDPRYEGRNTDMNIGDPFGNLLVFWLAKAAGDSE